MCDDVIHPGLIEDWPLSRRAFAAGALAAGFATAALAETVGEQDVTIATPDGAADAALFYPPGDGPWPAVLMWPDIMGLRPAFRAMGRRLAAEGYVVLVPNPFYRSRPAPVVDGSFSFDDPEMRNKLFGYRQAMSNEGIDKDAVAYLAFLDAQKQTSRGRPAGVQGYCMGGPLAFRTAAAAPGRIGAVASFHGAGLVTDAPDSPHLLIPRTRATFLVAIARNDDMREPAAKVTLRDTFRKAGRPATVEVHPADHGWCVPGGKVYDEAAAERAWSNLGKLYRDGLAAADRRDRASAGSTARSSRQGQTG